MNKFEEFKDRLLRLQDSVQTELSASVALELLRDEKFINWPASIDKHHNYQGGLLEHSVEVAELSMEIANKRNNKKSGYNINPETMFLSAILHDYGKVYTYKHTSIGPRYEWEKIKDYTKSLHIYKSIDKAKELLKDSPNLDSIIHIIGAHHGRLDYGALWEPQTPQAWIVHLADMNSVFSLYKG